MSDKKFLFVKVPLYCASQIVDKWEIRLPSPIVCETFVVQRGQSRHLIAKYLYLLLGTIDGKNSRENNSVIVVQCQGAIED